MSELYPTDETLLGMGHEPHTGIEFIPTGKTPYYLEFRKLMQRMTLATARSGDLRPFPVGDLAVGVKAGRCVINGVAINFAGSEESTLTNNVTSKLYLDSGGVLRVVTDDLPSDRSIFLPIAEVTTEQGTITEMIDLRGEAFLQTPTPRDGFWFEVVYTGALSTSQSEKVFALLPIDGRLTDVLVTVGSNIISTTPGDGVEAVVQVNDDDLCTINPGMTAGDGAGRRSTANGEGTAAVLDASIAQVSAGDLLSWSINLTTTGLVSADARDIVLAVHLQPG